jgi:AraC-like DNA-binding protein
MLDREKFAASFVADVPADLADFMANSQVPWGVQALEGKVRSMLIQARVDLAVRMLESPLFDRVTTAEIGRRAGFSDASHFVKVRRRHTGHTPLRVRRTRRG